MYENFTGDGLGGCGKRGGTKVKAPNRCSNPPVLSPLFYLETRNCWGGWNIIKIRGLKKAVGDAGTFFDPVSDKLGAIPYTTRGYDVLAYQIARALSYLARPPTKVVAVDCDNTLWEGQAGDSETSAKEVKPNLPLMKLLKERRDL